MTINSVYSAPSSQGQVGLTKDDIFKQHWDELADDWIALEQAMREKDSDAKLNQRRYLSYKNCPP